MSSYKQQLLDIAAAAVKGCASLPCQIKGHLFRDSPEGQGGCFLGAVYVGTFGITQNLMNSNRSPMVENCYQQLIDRYPVLRLSTEELKFNYDFNKASLESALIYLNDELCISREALAQKIFEAAQQLP